MHMAHSPVCHNCGAPVVIVVDLSKLETELANLRHLITTQGAHQMTAIENLQAVDAELAAAVTALAGDVTRIDTDFAALEAAVAGGMSAENAALIEAEVAKVRAAVDAAKASTAAIDLTDVPATAPVTPAP